MKIHLFSLCAGLLGERIIPGGKQMLAGSGSGMGHRNGSFVAGASVQGQ